MNQDPNSPKDKKSPSPSPTTPTRQGPPEVPKRPPLFRRIDWFTLVLTTFLVFLGYFLTIAPDLTLEDSGELATGSFYAGVPHPPGYPVWTIYTWFFTRILPWGNVAWRVGIGSAFAGALGCGFLALMASRGSSMIMESIESLKGIDRRWENAICVISGFVAGMVMGFNGYMWSQSVIVEVYSLSVLSLMGMMALILRWVYAPEQKRYLYFALFLFGICITNHQSLLVAAMGIQVAICAANPRLGRDCFAFNTIVYVVTLFLKAQGIVTKFDNSPVLFFMFNLIGIGSMVAAIVLTIKTMKLFTEAHHVLILAICFAAGAAFYFYMPIASTSNPPMNWGYPRTAEGFVHAFTRGQYEAIHPTDSAFRYLGQVWEYITGADDEFGMPALFIAVVPWIFVRRMQKRERAWLVGTLGVWFFLAFLLLWLLNPGSDRQSRELNRVFMTASHTMVSLWVGYGLTLIGAFLVTQYQKARIWVLGGAAVAIAGALFSLVRVIEETFSDLTENPLSKLIHGISRGFAGENTLEVVSCIFLLAVTIAFLLLVLVNRRQIQIPLVLALFALLPGYSIISHWFDNEQRDHMFGYWFGHDMFTPPFTAPDGKLSYDSKVREQMMKDPQKAKLIYPEMARDAVVFGGTDPGRFCPTYMIFCESFIPDRCKPRDPVFDRRDCYLITQNALADGTYLNYIRAHYNRSEEHDDPFFQGFFDRSVGRVLHPLWKSLDEGVTSLGEKIEKSRRCGTSYFQDTDYKDLASFANKLRSQQDPVSKFLFEHLSKETQGMLGNADDKLRAALSKDLDAILDREFNAVRDLASKTAEKDKLDLGGKDQAKVDALNKEIDALKKLEPLYTPERFKGVTLSDHVQQFITENPQSYTRVRLNRLLLEETYPKEIAKSLGGVFPDLEIHTPSPDESQQCFTEYLTDAQRRLAVNQLKPGEDVHIDNGRVQVTGQVAVMSINGLLTKVIFDKTPKHEFYVEESFPLDWMYPYQEPFGIIMKIDREPLKEMTQEIVDRDHYFWTEYSDRFIGKDVVKYETPVKDLCSFGEKMYLRHDMRGFKGDPKFIRDDNAQKAFSKLRSSIGGIYMWRYNNSQNPVEKERMYKEAEFAFKQAFAFCPFSPEAVYRYVQLLNSRGKLDDAVAIVRTCLKLDPDNGQIQNLLTQLEAIQKQMGTPHAVNAGSLFQQVGQFLEQKQTNEALSLLDQMLASPSADAGTVLQIAQRYSQAGDIQRLDKALEKLVHLAPDNPEAWYDYAGVQALLAHTPQATEALAKAITFSEARLAKQKATTPGKPPSGPDLKEIAKRDPRFAAMLNSPEVQKAIASGGK